MARYNQMIVWICCDTLDEFLIIGNVVRVELNHATLQHIHKLIQAFRLRKIAANLTHLLNIDEVNLEKFH